MKAPRYEATKDSKIEKSCVAVIKCDEETTARCHKASPVKEPSPLKPACPPKEVTPAFSVKSDTSAVHNKENSREHDRTQEEGFEDSGYLSLHNSHIDLIHGDEEDNHHTGKPTAVLTRAAAQKTPNNSPSKCTSASRPEWLVVSTPVDCPKRPASCSLSSTPYDHHSDLPLLKFQQSVCEKLAESYRKNKRYDWSIVSKIAEDHLLDRVIGGHMGLEYIDIFTSLLSLNMKSILANILALLGDMDLLSCKKVSRSWRKIISEDSAAVSRCQRAEHALRESRNSLRHRGSGLTRDVAMSRAVLSCMQTLASSKSSSSLSTTSCRTTRQTVSKKGSMPSFPSARFNEYIQAANNLKQHESLRRCKHCGSPATHQPEVQRATCTRASCLFDFCTHCQESFHGSTPCRTVQPRSNLSTSFDTTPVILGSARSKRSVRRL
ncbi:F-box only protein 5 [Parambassis ranga]|uniref:F-box only protein 5 n=1 Tax=Parambassis ranga TaxID=210632 RepID=A0A6P7JQX2_9TELE|nr:F-box only protein 5 [Parambassis ranga]XP_028279368.1 F-box only protein 5 [Parambassis ranga]